MDARAPLAKVKEITPMNIKPMQNSCSKPFCAEMSPYPTVVIVVMV